MIADLKQKLREIFGEQIVFNKSFSNYASTIKNLDVNIVNWCIAVRDGEIKAIPPKYSKDELVFIKKIGSSNRCIIIKIKNGEFKEIHLGDHDYYDDLRRKLGLKQDS